MAASDRATLSGFDSGLTDPAHAPGDPKFDPDYHRKLPVHFSYKPPVPRVRFAMHKTGDGKITFQGNRPSAGDAIIEWSCPSCTHAQYLQFLKLYTAPVTGGQFPEMRFTGYWGEDMTVICLEMEDPTVRATRFDLSGRFHVTAVTSWGSE